MTLEELGSRVDLDRPRVSRLEQAEVNDDLKHLTLIKIGDGLGENSRGRTQGMGAEE